MVLRNAGQYLYEKIYTERNGFIEKSIGGIIAASFLAGMAFPQVLEILFQENTSYATFVIQVIILVFIIIYARNLRSDKKELEKQEGKHEKWGTWEKEVEFELTLLQGRCKNFYVVNDFQISKAGNIDHIVICEKWVFAIETKNLSYIEKGSKKERGQAKNEAVTLQEILPQEFWIKWVSAIFTVINEDNLNYVQSEKYCEVCYYKDLWSKIQKSTRYVPTDQIENIYKYLVSLQQKKS